MTDSLLDSGLIQDPQIDPNKKYLSDLVGDGKPFKDPEALAKGKYHSDSLIKTYEVQMDQMRVEMQKLRDENVAKAKLEDLLDQWQKRPLAPPEIQDKSPSQSTQVDVKQMESLIDNRMQERETSRKQTENFNLVKAKLEETLGKNYSNSLAQIMSELDMSKEYLDNMAKNSPKALLKMLGIDSDTTVTKDPFRTPPRSQITPFAPNPPEKRSWSWYQRLKDTDPKKYYSRETNVQMHKDALQLGDAFEDGDFGRFAKDYRISF